MRQRIRKIGHIGVALSMICSIGVALSFGAQDRQKVSVLGVAAIHNNIMDVARDKAIDNALRAAVERVAGVMVTGSTEVENFQVKMDSILSESRGFVEQYRIVSERRDGDAYEVMVEADVGAGKLQDRMKAIDLLIHRKAKPRLMILFGNTAQNNAFAESAMNRFFLAKGFRLIDSSAINKKAAINASSANRGEKYLTGIAHQAGAEIILLGSAEAASNAITVSGIEMNINKVSISVKVINGDTGEIIATDSESRSAPGAKGDIKAITEEVAGKLATKILSGTLDHWSNELANTMTIKVLLSGLGDYQDLLQVKDQISLCVKGFRSLYQRSYIQGSADLDLEIKGDMQALADDLSNLTVRGKKIKLLELTPNRIVGSFVPL